MKYYIRNFCSYIGVLGALNILILRAILSRRSFDSELYLFRRNIHRIEKGLNNRERRIPFAQQYADKTYRFYAQNSAKLNSGDLHWAIKVLRHYKELHSLNWKFDHPVKTKKEIYETRDSEFLRLQKVRISVRNYRSTNIDIDKAIALAVYNATLIPSSCNRQSYNILIPKNEYNLYFVM